MRNSIIDKTIRSGYTYIFTFTIINSEIYGNTKVYGIGIAGDGREEFIDDISPDKNMVENLYHLICQEVLFPEHLKDVVEDCLAG